MYGGDLQHHAVCGDQCGHQRLADILGFDRDRERIHAGRFDRDLLDRLDARHIADDRGDLRHVALDLQLQPQIAAGAAFEILDRIDSADLALVDDDDALTDRSHLREDMRREDDRMLAGEILDQIADLHDLRRVKADRRLIENEEFRIAEQRLRKAATLPVALGKIADDAALHIGDAQTLHCVLDLLFPLGRRYFFQSGGKGQVVTHAHFRIDRRDLRQIADPLFDLHRILCDVVAVYEHRSGVGGEASRDHVHRRGFARAVRPEKSEDLMIADREGDILHGGMQTVVFGQILDFNHINVSPFRFLSAGDPQHRQPAYPYRQIPQDSIRFIISNLDE